MPNTPELHGSVRLRDIQELSRPVAKNEQHQVGKFYWNSYWQFVYQVRAINGTEVTVYAPLTGATWTHRTPLNKRDRALYLSQSLIVE